MADTKISALTGVTAVAAANEFAVNEAGTSKKATAAQIREYVRPVDAKSPASQVITANTVTYLTGSAITLPAAGLVVGQVFHWHILVSKTAAGTATPIWTFRCGTAGTTADATILTITGTAQVATLSGTMIIVSAVVRAVGASAVVSGGINTGAASFGIGGSAASSAFNSTAFGPTYKMGLCVNSGASAAWTVQSAYGELV